MKNGKPNQISKARLKRLEADIKEIKALLQDREEPKEPWWEKVVGTFANDPVGHEIIRLGLEVREKGSRQSTTPICQKRNSKSVIDVGGAALQFLRDTDHFSILQEDRDVAAGLMARLRLLSRRSDPCFRGLFSRTGSRLVGLQSIAPEARSTSQRIFLFAASARRLLGAQRTTLR